MPGIITISITITISAIFIVIQWRRKKMLLQKKPLQNLLKVTMHLLVEHDLSELGIYPISLTVSHITEFHVLLPPLPP